MVYDTFLADRIREALASHEVREVKMFGGLSFIVNDKILATANNHGDLMVRCDPDVVGDLLDRKAASWAGMKGRKMSKGWIRVKLEGYENDDDFKFWIDVALQHNQNDET